jgi:hypothetical protein
MLAGLIAYLTHIDLQRLNRPTFENSHTVRRQSFVKAHLSSG